VRLFYFKAEELATRLVARMAEEKDTSTLSGLAAGLGALKDKVGSAKAEELATKLVARLAEEKDAERLRLIGYTLVDLPVQFLDRASLNQAQPLLEIPNAPCRLVLKFPTGERHRLMLSQIRNPACAEADWRQLALELSKNAPQRIAWKEDNRIGVDFAQLAIYVAGLK
jgi:hypothetical protein